MLWSMFGVSFCVCVFWAWLIQAGKAGETGRKVRTEGWLAGDMATGYDPGVERVGKAAGHESCGRCPQAARGHLG